MSNRHKLFSILVAEYASFSHQATMLNPFSASFPKWSNTFKQFVGKLSTNCLSVFDHLVGLALKGLSSVCGIHIFTLFRLTFSLKRLKPQFYPGLFVAELSTLYVYGSIFLKEMSSSTR